MSILFSLRKLVDPTAHSIEECERRTERQRPRRAADGDRPPERDRPLERWRCRVCGHQAGDGSFCPVCLADTMERALNRP
jgi:rubrerythrin